MPESKKSGGSGRPRGSGLKKESLPEDDGLKKDAETPEKDTGRRIMQVLFRPSRSQFIVALVLCLVAIGVVVQIRSQSGEEAYRTARRADLIQLIDGLAEESRRMEREIAELEGTKRELESGSDARRVARDEAQRRLDALSVLGGTAPANGPGIQITITDHQGKVGPSVILDALGEMRDAGAEVMEFNDRIRVTAATWVSGTPGALIVDNQPMTREIVLEVIGEPHALEEAARFRGGLVSEVTAPTVGATITVQPVDRIDIQSVVVPDDHEFARPAR